MIRNHNPIDVPTFNGLFVRGRYDAVPLDHFSDTLNTQPSQNGWDTRDGFQQSYTIDSVLRMYVYKIFGQADRLLILDNDGQIWDSVNSATPILTIVGMTDFAFANIYGRAYISPSNGITGLAGEKLYVYSGSGVAVAAAGLAPSGAALVAANSASAGNCEAGIHLYAVVYETKTGFLTAPGPALFAQLNQTGGKNVDLSVIPIGPSNVIARRIIATQVIAAYNGDQTALGYFFVPNGRIPDNTTTAISLSFYDSELLNDASYLFNLFSQIPAGVHLGNYNGRLVSAGEAVNPSVCRISNPAQPEAINQVDGLLVVDPANTSSAVNHTQPLREAIYLFKKTRTYATVDNGGPPATWNVITIDEGLGCDVNSAVTILDTAGASSNMVLIGNQQGLYIFNGQFVLSELSWKIRDLWATINGKYFNNVCAVQDPIAQRVYIAAPLGSNTTASELWVMDYANANLNAGDYQNVRWTRWQLANNAKPTSIVVETSPITNTQMLRVGSINGDIYNLVPGLTNDFGYAIPTPYIQTGYISGREQIYYHTIGVVLRVVGSGILITTIYGYDKLESDSCPAYTLSTTSSISPLLLANLINQKFIVKLQVNNIDEYFDVNNISIYLKPSRTMMPG